MPHTPERNRHISRRRLLKGAIGVGLSLPALIACEATQPESAKKEYTFTLTGEAMDVHIPTLGYYPDGHISYINRDGQLQVYISANDATYLVDVTRPAERTFVQSLQETTPVQVWGPSADKEYKNGYAAFSSILPTTNPNLMYALVHQEHREEREDSGNFVASIGMVRSNSKGRNWFELDWRYGGQFDTPENRQKAKKRAEAEKKPYAFGAGQAVGILDVHNPQPTVNIYYVDWTQGFGHPDPAMRKDQIHMLQAPLQTDGSIDFEKIKFRGDPKTRHSVPVVPVPEHIPQASYAGLPSVSWNSYLEKYLMIFETARGFCTTTSDDGIQWDKAKLIAEFPQPRQKEEHGSSWASYPTLISPDGLEATDKRTDQYGWLAYAVGKRGISSHSLKVAPFKLS